MITFTRIAAVAVAALAVSACSGNDAPDSGEVTETRMDDVDVIDGTISDDMVDVDTITEVDATGEETGDSSAKKEDTASTATGDSEAEAAE
ncbi:hypothetical protein C8024_04445 [Sphingopyxis sp. BSNA05]|uniref:hypothetical protein n=1 Tax=Sphingomonadales TaxID=204457 RepID=UPI000C1E6608|nr:MULTISPECIES: hypothetical protein [Sphingomonadaceae]ATW04661.1 hypothetical protein CHN51_14800 [Sphingorhabdus sp. YGSMI21]NRD88868.1 hypothetical protein [Sphingopyxis sp. BSNA05]